MNTSITDSNPTAHLMLIQNRAHHEDRLIHTKPTVDTRLKDFSHLLRPSIPSKKTYINKEKIKKINQDNVNLLSKIYKITFDKNNEPVSRYGTASKNSRREDGAHIELHPFSYDHRSRSLNNANRRKELEKINKDNSHLLTKLRTMKPTVPAVSECKQRKKKLDYLKQLIHRRDDEQPNRVLQPYLHQKGTGGSVFDQYMQRHDPIVRRNSVTMNQDAIYVTNENHQSGVSIRTKNGRRMRKADSREGSFDDNRNNVSHALNSSEIVSRSVDPDLFDNNLAGNYKSNPSKKTLLPQVSNEPRKKTVEDLDKKVNPIVSQDSLVPEEEIQDEVDARILKSIKEDDIKEEISHGGDSSHREKVAKNSRVLNRTNPPS